MADDPTIGELWRRQVEHEARTDRARAEVDNRIARVAADSVPSQVWTMRQQAWDEQIRALTERIREVEEHLRQTERQDELDEKERLRERARDRRLVLAAFVSPLLLLLVQLYLSGKGA
ncbi:hypothetical protein [Streptomyces sp. NPDC001404]|uniref:hypothetical protein n=1 Tax=Streptomyces sp. NPDC001404 TaxID=3364571 RepID=UPI0036BCD062